jgi:hypothetical protein
VNSKYQSGSRVSMTKKLKKMYSWQKNLIFFKIKNKRRPKLQETPSAQKREHPTLQNIKFLNFFLFLWVIFALQDPDPLTWLYPNPIRNRIRNNESYSSIHCVHKCLTLSIHIKPPPVQIPPVLSTPLILFAQLFFTVNTFISFSNFYIPITKNMHIMMIGRQY